MRAMLEDLLRHKWWADATMLGAIQNCGPAAEDEGLRKTLHHMYFSNRFWIALLASEPFDRQAESAVPDSLQSVIARFRDTQQVEIEWLGQTSDADLERTLEAQALPGQKIPVREALLQIVLHTQGHRAQCASRLRALGGTPPTLDYVLWAKNRPGPAWPA